MTPDEAQKKGFGVSLVQSSDGPTFKISGLEAMIQAEMAKSQPDFESIVKAIRETAFDSSALLEAIRSIVIQPPDMSALVEAISSITFEVPAAEIPALSTDAIANAIKAIPPAQFEVMIDGSKENRPLIQSASVEHEVVRGVPMLSKIMFNYGE